MRFLDLFAGIGGMSLGLERTGMVCAGHVERDEFCQGVLMKHWPEVPLVGNVEDVEGGDEFGPVDVVCGGPPCQPASLAGKMAGRDDDRWLWHEACRVVGLYGPRWILLENPPGLASVGLDRVLADLEALGYRCPRTLGGEAVVPEIPACGVNAPHLRHRLWIVGHRSGARQPQGDTGAGFQGNRGGGMPQPHGRSGGAVRALEHASLSEREGHGSDGGKVLSKEKSARIERPNSETGCFFAPSYDGKWRRFPSIERGVSFVVDGIPAQLARLRFPLCLAGVDQRAAKLRAVGNSAHPGVVEQIGRAMMQAEGR